MFKKLVLAAAALAISAPVLADPHRKQIDRHHFDRGHQYGHGHRPVVRHVHRPVVVMPPPRVYYAPPPRVVYAPVYRPAPVYYPAPVYHSPAPYGGISIRFNIPF
jgi:hypothetical protein